jgi:hypothetical protein
LNQKLRLSLDLRRGLRIYSNYFLGVPIKLVLLRLFLKIFELKLCVAVGFFKFSAACYPEFAFSLTPYSSYNCSTFAWENASMICDASEHHRQQFVRWMSCKR